MSTVETTGLKKDVEKWREVLVITDSVLGWEKVDQSNRGQLVTLV